MSANVAVPDFTTVNPDGAAGPVGLSPAQLRTAYGYNSVQFSGGITGDGTGQTIAIIDAYDDPDIASDLQKFDAAYGLANPTFTKVNETGGTTLPAANASWATEISLDVEWAHAMAPGAKILLVEANSASYTDLFTAVDYAKAQTGVSVVSMSFGGGEFNGETSLDSTFTSPASHGVTFVASSGDNGSPGGYPAYSTHVLAVGGTTLTLGANNSYGSESVWSDSGGGVSAYESKPTYQKGVTQSSTMRTAPDVAFDANPSSGVAVYDSYGETGAGGWEQVGGTSMAAPSWAALIAIADQGRALAGQGSLDGYSQTLPMLYALPASDYHLITSGSNGTYSANASGSYNLVTGIGSPRANLIALGLISPTAPAPTPTPPAPTPTPTPPAPTPTPPPAPPATTYQGGAISILPSTQSWTGLIVPSNFEVSKLTVSVNITYPKDGDLDLYLVSPAGRVVELSYHDGGSGANYTTTTFADAGTISISAGAAPFNGTYRSLTPLSVFANLNAKGTWWLVAEDDGSSKGTLTSWSLSLTGTSGATGTGPALVTAEADGATFMVSTNPLATVPQMTAAATTTETQSVHISGQTTSTDNVFSRFVPQGLTSASSATTVDALVGSERIGSDLNMDALDTLFQSADEAALVA